MALTIFFFSHHGGPHPGGPHGPHPQINPHAAKLTPAHLQYPPPSEDLPPLKLNSDEDIPDNLPLEFMLEMAEKMIRKTLKDLAEIKMHQSMGGPPFGMPMAGAPGPGPPPPSQREQEMEAQMSERMAEQSGMMPSSGSRMPPGMIPGGEPPPGYVNSMERQMNGQMGDQMGGGPPPSGFHPHNPQQQHRPPS